MQAYIDYLKSDFEDVNIIFIDYMDLEFAEIKEYHALHKFVEDKYDKDKLFEEYFIKGGLAGSYAYNTDLDRTTYIKEVYETIVCVELLHRGYEVYVGKLY